MKKGFLLSLALSLLLPAVTSAAPHIVNIADTPSGYTMVVSGGGYDPEKVQAIVHVPGPPLRADREKMPELVRRLAAGYSGKPKALPVKPPADKVYTAPRVKVTGHSVMVTLLNSAPFANPIMPGYTGIVWLKDGEALSNPMTVNRTRALFLMKMRSHPGELNRLYGFNLKGDPYVPNYIFMRRVGGGPVIVPERVKLHAEDGVSENYCIQFRVPNDLPDGDYEVFAHNNSGGEYGFSEALPFKVSAAPLFRETVYNGAENGLVGDSVTDNLKALQALVDRAGSEGGGIVFLPPGSYRLSNTLQLRDGVVLRGAGRDATTLFYGDAPGIAKKDYWFISSRDVDRTSIEDMTIRVDHPMSVTVSYYKGGRPIDDISVRRCRFQGGAVRLGYGINAEVSDNIFQNSTLFLTNQRQSIIRGNDLTAGRLGGSPFIIWASEKCTIEHNRIHGSNRGIVWQLHSDFGHYRNFIDANLVETTRLGGNAGETYLFEGSGFKWHGRPGVFAAAGFTVPGAGWKPDALKNAFAVVVDGIGTGQYVRIAANSDDTVTLERPWPALQPAAGAAVTVMHGVVENIFINNRDVDCDNSIMFYGAGIVNNRIQRNRSENGQGISIWSQAEAAGSILVPDYFNIFEGNVIEDQGAFWLTRLGDLKQESGLRNWNNIFRNNFLADVRRKRQNQYGNIWELNSGTYRPVQAAFWMDIGTYYGRDRTQSPLWVDTLIERNYITRSGRGVELGAISGGTAVRENTFFDVARPIIDQGQGSLIEKNRIEEEDGADD